MKRREVLKGGAAALAASMVGKNAIARHIFDDANLPQLTKRKYSSSVDLSIIGFGGIVVVGMEQKQADRIVSESIEAGVNYFDVAPTYADGEAEEKLGKAIRPYRKDIFLACKTTQRKAKEAQEELETSLKRIGVDHVDLYQFHAVTTMEDVEQILGPGGAAETFVRAQQRGKIRFIGFSAHSQEAALALLERFTVNSVLFPINFVCYAHADFGPKVVAKAKEKGAARLALKTLAHTPLPQGEENKYPKCWYKPVSDQALAAKALGFTLSQDITAAIPPGDERLYKMALGLARKFKPLSESEIGQLLSEAKNLKSLFPLS
jgi:aryl-alcohol dehydrogenase-like predicted oxidoreductase